MVFAYNLPLYFILIASTVGCVTWCAIRLLPGVRLDAIPIVWFIILLIAAAVLGFLIGFLAAAVFFPPLYQFQARRNGAPYAAGDWVRILVGKHRGKVVRIYDIWECRFEVRVELGEEASERFKDLFSYCQICRHPAPM